MVVGCVGTDYALRVELTVQRRLYLIFVRDVRLPSIHERFRGLTGSQRIPPVLGRDNGSPRAHNKWAECLISVQIDGFAHLRVNKPGTNLVLLHISFVFVSLNKNLSF